MKFQPIHFIAVFILSLRALVPASSIAQTPANTFVYGDVLPDAPEPELNGSCKMK